MTQFTQFYFPTESTKEISRPTLWGEALRSSKQWFLLIQDVPEPATATPAVVPVRILPAPVHIPPADSMICSGTHIILLKFSSPVISPSRNLHLMSYRHPHYQHKEQRPIKCHRHQHLFSHVTVGWWTHLTPVSWVIFQTCLFEHIKVYSFMV